MPVKWDDESEKNLLLCILHVLGPQAPTPNWKQVAALMGPEYTGEGIRQKYTKGLKKQALTQFGEVEGDGGGKTPVKKVTGETKSAGSKRKAKKVDKGEEEQESPSKKMKVEPEEESDEDAPGELV